MSTIATDSLLNPPSLGDYSDYFKTLLSVAGVLLGLAFTGLIFVIQSGFASFKFSRRMFLEYYAVFGRNLLLTLSYLTLIPFGELYFGRHRRLLSLIYYVFCLIFVKSFLDIYKQQGYIHTLFSTRFVPQRYGKIRKYFRYIRNLGLLPLVFLVFSLHMLLAYPVAISFFETGSLVLTTKAFFYSTLLLLAVSIIRIANFIPHFFKLSNLEVETNIRAETEAIQNEESGVDYVKEKAALRVYLFHCDKYSF